MKTLKRLWISYWRLVTEPLTEEERIYNLTW